jgi:signal transduction histidine kinase
MERQEMAELGRVLAGATHDLNNVLAVIKEATGLADDALNAGGQPAEFRGRLEKVIGRVMRQVARGTEIITALNRFAHSLDEYRQETSAADVLERVVFLAPHKNLCTNSGSGRSPRQWYRAVM